MDTKFASDGVKYKTKSVYRYNACNLDRLFFFFFFYTLGSVILTIPCILLTEEPVEVHTIICYSRRDFHMSGCFFHWKDVLNLLAHWLFLPSLSVISGYVSLF